MDQTIASLRGPSARQPGRGNGIKDGHLGTPLGYHKLERCGGRGIRKSLRNPSSRFLVK